MEIVTPDTCLIPGHPLRLEVEIDKHGEIQVAVYPSMVIALEPDVLYVDIPKYKGYLFELPEHTPVHAVLHTDDAMYSFDTEVTGYARAMPVAMCLAVPEAVMRVQRRGTIRVPAKLPMRVTSHPGLDVTLKDVSAGGVGFASPRELTGRLQLQINLAGYEGEDWLDIAAIVRRCNQVQGGYAIACSFEDMTPKDEDRVVAFLFKRQREMRKVHH